MNTCLKYGFVVLNLLFMVAGALCIVFIVWIETVPVVKDVVSIVKFDDLLFYSALVLGCVLIVVGFCGTFGACYEKRWILAIYLVIMVVFIGGEATAIVYTIVGGQTAFVQSLESLWEQLSNDTKNLVQEKFQCCGYTNSSEWNGAYPPSCYNTSTNGTEIWKETCSQSVLIWFRDNIIAIGAALAAAIIFQLIQIVVTGLLIRSAGQSNQIDDEESDVTSSPASPRGKKSGTTYANRAYDHDYYEDAVSGYRERERR